MAKDLEGHISLVTGGNSGIGLGITRGLANAGASIAIWGTSQAKNESARHELERIVSLTGAAVRDWQCNVSEEESVEAAFDEVVTHFGRVDSCFASAGVSSDWSSFSELTLAEWHRVLGVNLDGVFLTMRSVVRHMLERGGGGSLVAVSSVASYHGQSHGAQYSASKGGLDALMRSCAVELAKHGIRANVIVPGSFRTAMAGAFVEPGPLLDRNLSRIPLRRVAEPDEIGAIAVYLAGSGSSYHTGDSLVIDGGHSVF